MPVKDFFYDYLEWCETEELMSPSEYLQFVARSDNLYDFVRLASDCIDTHSAGTLAKIKLPNGGVAYVRKLRTFITS